MSTGTEAAAVARGLAFLERGQLPGGAFPVLASTDPGFATGAPDPSVFPTALVAHCLSFAPAAAEMRARACDFLEREMDRHGLWKHWSREHPQYASLPPDLDDTSCAAAALAAAGRDFPDPREILFANRDRQGRFLTWVVPRLRWTAAAHRRATLPQLRRAPRLFIFFRRTSAKASDVDAVVNANALFHLGPVPETEQARAFLLAVLRDGDEAHCDKWYESPFAIWYFLSRALAGAAPEAGRIICERIASARPASALEAALAVCALHYWRAPVPTELIELLLARQRESGGWPAAPLYHGGRRRLGRRAFAPPHPDTPHWGSEALTTAVAVEALSRREGADGHA